MNSVGADKPMRLWHLTWKKGVMEKTTKFFEKTCTPPVERVLGKHFLTSFNTNGEDHKRRRLIILRVFYSDHVTLFLLKWLLAAHLGLLSPPRSILLNSWAPERAVDLLVNLVRWQWARHWAHCGLCVTQQECPELLRVQEASAWIECPCYIRALYLIHKQFILPLLSLGESWIVTCDYCNWMAGCNLRAVTCIPMLS